MAAAAVTYLVDEQVVFNGPHKDDLDGLPQVPEGVTQLQVAITHLHKCLLRQHRHNYNSRNMANDKGSRRGKCSNLPAVQGMRHAVPNCVGVGSNTLNAVAS